MNNSKKVKMKKTLTAVICFLMVALMALSCIVPAFAAENDAGASYGPLKDTKWVQEDGNWRYKMENGTYARSAWIKYITDNGDERYYVDANGNMVCNDWAKIDGKWHTLGPDGKVVTKTWVQRSNGYWIWSDGSGKLTNGWATINGNEYHFDSNGCMDTGWYQDGDAWYFLNDSGEKYYGWVKLGDDWYYLDSENEGKMVTGEKTIDGKKYLFSYTDGALR